MNRIHTRNMPFPSVAICIPTRNQANHLPSSVRTAASQRYGGPLDIWVADDASTDDTKQVLERLAKELPGLHVMRQSEQAGIPANCSALMRRPSADYLVRLDSDDELEPDYVSRMVSAMEAHPTAGYGHTAIIQIDERGNPLGTRRLIRASGYQNGEAALRASLSGYRTVANILIFRRGALEELNYYDSGPELRQDYDLAIRMADGGYGNVYLDEPLARYRVWTDPAGIRAKRKAAQLKGYRQIFDETFAPAWKRRGWDARELERQRRKLALHHCAACFDARYSRDEQVELIHCLRMLGDSRRLRLSLAASRLGLAPLLSGFSHIRFGLKRIVKDALKATRRKTIPPPTSLPSRARRDPNLRSRRG